MSDIRALVAKLDEIAGQIIDALEEEGTNLALGDEDIDLADRLEDLQATISDWQSSKGYI